MTDRRFSIPAHGMSFLLFPPWELRPPWNDPDVQREHGVYLSLADATLQLHVRGGPRFTHPSYPLTPEGLERYLFDQGWASQPFDVVRWREPPLAGIAGTFQTTFPGNVRVREWYVTDGQSLADCSALGAESELATWLTSCDTVARSILFENAPRGTVGN